ncbi:MAG: exosortase A [Pseudomonadota bacterium]
MGLGLRRKARNLYWEAAARWRKRDPVPRLPRLDRNKGFKILLVCVGNICRSPLAEVLGRELAAEKGLVGGLTFRSAGLTVAQERPADPHAVAAAAEIGLDLSSHRSRRVTAEMIQAADLVIVMEEWHGDDLLRRYRIAEGPLVSLARWAAPGRRGAARYNVLDPFGQDLDAFRACRDHIRECLSNLLDRLASQPDGAPEAAADSDEPARPALPLLHLGLLLAAWCLVCAPTLRNLCSAWLNEPENSHGLLVPFISGWLVWTQRRHLAVDSSASGGGLALLLAGLLVYMVGVAGFVRFLAGAAVVAGLSGLAWYNLGWRSFRKVAFPFAFLIFAVPAPLAVTKLVSFPLQLFASRVSAAVLAMLSIPVLREGNMLFFSNAQLEVAEACSGIRSMVALLMMGALFAYLLKRPWPARLAVVAFAVPVAIIMNIIRVTGTGILAYRFGEQAAQGFFHEFSGLVVFAMGFAAVAAFYLFLERSSRAR